MYSEINTDELKSAGQYSLSDVTLVSYQSAAGSSNSKKISISLRPRVQPNKFFTASIVNYQRTNPMLKNLYYKKIISLLEKNNNSDNEIILTNNDIILEGCTTNILCVRMKKIYMPL